MARAERIFRYPEHKAFKTVRFASQKLSQEECQTILDKCAATNSTLIIFTDQACVFFPSTELMKVNNLPEKERKKFLANGSKIMKLGQNFSIKTPTHTFSNN